MQGSNHYCWRGPPGSGKRHAIHAQLQKSSEARGVALKITTKLWSLEKPREDDSAPGEDEEAVNTKDFIPFETSAIHFGFDVSRMSLQDRHILKPIIERLGKGSHVLSGTGAAAARILVFYHIHLLSTESCVILQSLLEQEGADISIWCTSEHPLPIRIAHHFKEIGVGGPDLAVLKIKEQITAAGGKADELFDPQTLFDQAMRRFARAGPPTIHEVAGIRAFLYECLVRNIRWIECVHHILISVLRLPLPDEHRLRALRILAKQEGTAAGQTIPSYRIPIAWENLFLQIRQALSGALPEEDADNASPPKGTGGDSPSGVPAAKVTVDQRVSVKGRRAVGKKGGAATKPL